MPQDITIHVQTLVEAAERVIETLSTHDALALHGRDDVVFVDLRDIRELHREGRVPGAFHCPRGMLEFWIDPQSKYHKPIFAADKRFVFFCAAGQRSALAAETAQREIFPRDIRGSPAIPRPECRRRRAPAPCLCPRCPAPAA